VYLDISVDNPLLVEVINDFEYLREVVLHNFELPRLKFRATVDQLDEVEEISIAAQFQNQPHQCLPPQHLPQSDYSRVGESLQNVSLSDYFMHFFEFVYVGQVDDF
jgi:hypothetical protein